MLELPGGALSAVNRAGVASAVMTPSICVDFWRNPLGTVASEDQTSTPVRPRSFAFAPPGADELIPLT